MPQDWKTAVSKYEVGKKYVVPEIEKVKGFFLYNKLINFNSPGELADNLKTLGTKMEDKWGQLVGKELTYVGKATTGMNPKFNIEYSTKPGDEYYLDIALWLKPGDLGNNLKRDEINGEIIYSIINVSFIELTYYEENPNIYEFQEIAGGEKPETDGFYSLLLQSRPDISIMRCGWPPVPAVSGIPLTPTTANGYSICGTAIWGNMWKLMRGMTRLNLCEEENLGYVVAASIILRN